MASEEGASRGGSSRQLLTDRGGSGQGEGAPPAAADMEGDAAIEGGQLAPLLGSRWGGSGSPVPDASLLRRLYAGHALARWGARCVQSVSSQLDAPVTGDGSSRTKTVLQSPQILVAGDSRLLLCCSSVQPRLISFIFLFHSYFRISPFSNI